jgi:hypothetical protein
VTSRSRAIWCGELCSQDTQRFRRMSKKAVKAAPGEVMTHVDDVEREEHAIELLLELVVEHGDDDGGLDLSATTTPIITRRRIASPLPVMAKLTSVPASSTFSSEHVVNHRGSLCTIARWQSYNRAGGTRQGQRRRCEGARRKVRGTHVPRQGMFSCVEVPAWQRGRQVYRRRDCDEDAVELDRGGAQHVAPP